MIETTQLGYGVLAFLISLIMTPVVRLVAIKNGWVARPKEDRWHKKTTALMGGIAIFLGIGISILIGGDLYAALREITFNGQGKPVLPLSIVVFGGTLILFLLGLADDFVNLKPQTKLIGQITVASVVIFFGISPELVYIPDLGYHVYPDLDCRHHQRLQPVG